MTSLPAFTPATRAWFGAAFAAPTEAQARGWEAIARGDHTLIHAPTGSGKTLAAFLWAIDSLASADPPPQRERCRVLYVSPMKALAYDVERNLRAPLAGIRTEAARLGTEVPAITTAMRTGDTPAAERQAMLRRPPDILITTPESLFLMLTSRAAEMLRTVRWVIVDEVHAVAGSKRGSHLSLSLERLTARCDTPPQRIGLSATQRPLEAIAELLGGGTPTAAGWRPRPVTVVDAPGDKVLDLQIVVPVADMTRPEETPLASSGGGDDAPDPARRSVWPAMYPQLLALVEAHRSTLLFVNARGLAERLAAEINQLAGRELVRSHHGSVSPQQRVEIEEALKAGELRGVVATSTLELGIDMAAIDLVVLVETPPSVASGLQRVGRAGHQVGAPSVARIFPKHRGDLLEAAVVVDRMMEGAIEHTRIPQNPLDVLAQHVVSTAAAAPVAVDALFDLVRGAAPYRDLSRPVFEAVLDMLAGIYPSDEFSELRPRIVWDRLAGTVAARGDARRLAVTNAGTIPDRGLYTVTLPEGGRVGELDEEMVYESRAGDVFVLGSSTWRIEEITLDRVVVTPAPAEPARMPFWHGDRGGRPLELGRAVGEFVRRVGAMSPDQARTALTTRYRLDPWAAANLMALLDEEREATGTLPSDRTVVVERFRDEIGDWRIVVLSPFGGRVHAPWALAARHRLRERLGIDVDVLWTDDGMMFRFPDVDDPPPTDDLVPDPDEISELLLSEVADSALFTSKFRESAARALLLPRRRPGSRTPLWLQRRRAAGLLQIATRYPSFPIVLETYREVLQDHFDVAALSEVLADVAARRIRVAEADLAGPSPFASSLMFDFVASFMYEYDAPVAEKRAAALTLDRALLEDLLGDPDFRDLLAPGVIADVEAELQRLAPSRHIGSADALHDALRDLGPLSAAAIAARCGDRPAAGWIAELEEARRIVALTAAGEARYAAVEDLSRLRDALGVVPPPWLPAALLRPLPDPLGDVVGRHARTRGPFTTTEAATDLGLPAAAVEDTLRRLEGEGRLTRGRYRSGAAGEEWVDREVLRRLRRRSLALLRSQVEAVEPAALARFATAWHGIGSGQAHQRRLLEVVSQLQGAVIPAAALESALLPARMSYRPADLDALLASGEVVWVGCGPLGNRDGRITLYQRHQVPLLHRAPDAERPASPLHEALRGRLAERGASLFHDLYAAAGGGPPDEVLAALWDLVWAGEVTNDTLAPLRAFLAGSGRHRQGRRPLPAAAPPAGTGRWYLTAELVGETGGSAVTPEARAATVAQQLLERHGVLTRDAVLAEGIPGGFAGLYPVLAALEDAGRVRRGYFVEGRGGSQFALPGAVDRLRAAEAGGAVVLAAADPANPYGAALPWPEHGSGRPARRSGAHVVLDGGRLAAYVDRGGRTVLTFAGASPEEVVAGLSALAERGKGRLTVASVDGEPVTASPLHSGLLAAGFVPGYRGVTLDTRKGR